MKKITLHLDGTSPDRLSMSRLAEYLRELSTLLGSKESVHFEGVTEGSACLNTLVEDDQYQSVLLQARSASGGEGAKRAQKAYKQLASLMEEDRVDGTLLNGTAQILVFPKAKTAVPPILIRKKGSVQGRLYIVGGKDDTVPVRLEGAAGETLMCEVGTALAEELGGLLFKHVRLHGEGVWESRPNGGWRLKKLEAHSFDRLESSTLKSGLKKLRALSEGGVSGMDDAHRLILELRG
ncbi:hypothetical protein AO286_25700 [Pseudomonas syringae]|uniref:Uncharacterized protein n=3 Tax=Pseudomonas syringae group TaxID=136849 RepID=A0ABD6V9X2_9PSED|nr:hypothetical protein AL046_00105 [Pseudomonas syringae pv. avii]PHN58555.1 hypothetical protein AO286_25700 [Pseudomonas syringae]POD67180.1 hypothetical protein BKM07_17840 [Pseudomonas syringae group genomosp. 3]POQ06950.1 hypothetical protein CXB40_17825 [Pseudomonas syringae pv. avii]